MSPRLHEFLLRAKSLFKGKRMQREMAEELQFHQALLREKLIRQGMPASQAERETRVTFGNPARWQERLRELWQFRTVENLLRDISFSFRLLRKSPGFTVIALLTLALGVGANTSVFSLINSLLLRPLPVPHSEQLVVLGMNRGRPEPVYSFPEPFFRALESKHEIFQQAFAFHSTEMLIKGRSGTESVRGMMVSGDYFSALQIAPLIGRALGPLDDRTGGSPEGFAVVLSERFWESHFDRSQSALGSKMLIANTPFTIVGVMPKRFIGADPTQLPEFYVPLVTEPVIDAPTDLIKAGFHGWWLTVMARLQPGVSLDRVNAALEAASLPILHQTVPDAGWIANVQKQHFRFLAEPGSHGFTYIRFLFQKPLIALFCMCSGILLLACLNLASLLTARGTARERELATRLSMGATRARLVQQLLTECLLIALIGTGIGLAVAPAVSHALAAMLLSGNARGVYIDTSLDLRVFGFAALVAIVATLMIGLIPALEATSGNLNDHIKEGQHSSTQRRRRLLQPILLASEVGLALMLVVGAGLLATSLYRLFASGSGFNAKGVANIEFSMNKQQLDGEPLVRLYQQIGEGLSSQPGVTAVSFARMVPLTHFIWDTEHARPGAASHDLYLNAIAPRYFEAMGIPFYQGRDFRWSDTPETTKKIIINEATAQLLFPNQSPVGQHILQSDNKTEYEIIAVVGSAKYEDLRTPPPAAAYLPITQLDDTKPSYYAIVRTNGPIAPLAAAARGLAAHLAPDIPPPVLTTLQSVVEDSVSTERVMAMLSVFFAACALLVTGIGLYGTLAYATARRTSEIGIRIALGARRSGVVALIFRHNLVVAGAGLVAGLATAFLGSRALATFLYQTSPRDPWIMLGSVVALALIASAASLLPAIRAARIEPIVAIRYE